MKTPLNRGGLRFYLVLIALARGCATHFTILAGIPFILLGVALHVWAKGCLHQNRVLAKIGPYRFVRHPFYLANALIDAGIAVMSGWWVLQILLPVWWLGIYLPVMRREDSYLAGLFGAAYEQYRKRVPHLVPCRRPLSPSAEGFSWSNPNIASGSELSRALRILAYPLLFLVCTNLSADGLSFFADVSNLATLAALGAWYTLAWALRRHLLPTRDTIRHATAVAVLCGLCCLVQAVLVCRAPVPSPDAVRFACAAQAIDQQGLVPALRVQPGHPLFPTWVWIVHDGVRCVAGDFPAAWAASVQFAAAVPLVLLVVPVYFLCVRMWGRTAGWFAGLLLCLLPEVARLGAEGLGDSTYLLLIATALWSAVAWLERSPQSATAPGGSWLGVDGLWLLAAGLATGMAALTRSEALVLPVALVATLACLEIFRRWRQPWRRLAAGAACFALSFGLVVGPYLWTMGSLAPRDAVDRLLGRYDVEQDLGLNPAEKAAAGWQLPDGQRMSFAPKDPSVSVRKWGLFALTEKLAVGLGRASGYVTGLLGLLGLWHCRRWWISPAGWLLAVFSVLFSLAATCFAAREGYLTARHLLTLVVPGIGLSGLGVLELGRIASCWRPLGKNVATPRAGSQDLRRRRRHTVEWIAVAVAGLVLVLANVVPPRACSLGYREVGQWLAADAPEPGMVVDTLGWTGLYSGRPTFLYEDAPLVLADSRLAYLVIEQSELEYASARGLTLRMLVDEASERVAEFPRQRALSGDWQTVVVYRWHPERFRQELTRSRLALSSCPPGLPHTRR